MPAKGPKVKHYAVARLEGTQRVRNREALVNYVVSNWTEDIGLAAIAWETYEREDPINTYLLIGMKRHRQ